MGKFYDGTKILSMLDLERKTPEIYMVSTNRSGGKTTYFGRMLVNRFIKNNRKFMLIYRNKYEIEHVADKFFKDLNELFFPEYEMSDKCFKQEGYTELYLNDIPCGYAVALNGSEQVKKLSHFFSDTDSMLFDEFQSETDTYVPNELQKFISIHTSVARGGGKSHRYLPVYMISNPVSIINPYYSAMGVTNRLSDKTKFLRGNGYVVEQGFVEAASSAQKESGFNKAFAGQDYVGYSQDGIYLNDSKIFIETPKGTSRYSLTIKYKNKFYGIRQYEALGLVFVGRNWDKTYPFKIAVTTDDLDINYISIKNYKWMVDNLKYYFHKGCFRFQDLQSKEALITLLSV